MKKRDKYDKAILECYVELYKHATPQADFNELVASAGTNELGQKVIEFNNYEMDETLACDIISTVGKKYKFSKWEQKQLSVTIHLGCSPKFTK